MTTRVRVKAKNIRVGDRLCQSSDFEAPVEHPFVVAEVIPVGDFGFAFRDVVGGEVISNAPSEHFIPVIR